MNRTLPAELGLAAACCAWPPSPQADARVRSAAERVRDWGHFDAVVRRNRITPLVHHALSRAQTGMPENVGQEISQRARAAATRALTMTRECVRLQRLFELEGFPCKIVKGIPVALLAYGNLAMKESCDIDLLTSPEKSAEARQLAMREGYEPVLGRLSPSQFERYLEHVKEAPFVHTRSGVALDLHWRLMPDPRLLRDVDVHSASQTIYLPGGSLVTLSDELLFCHLCAHGAFHNWNRLKWIADLSAFLAARSATQIEAFWEIANARGIGRRASVAILLCWQLVGLAIEKPLIRAVQRDRFGQALAANVIGGLAYGGGAREHDGFTTPWLRMTAAQFVSEPGLALTSAQIRRFWNSPVDRARIPLPRYLTALHHLLRVPLFLVRIPKRFVGRMRASARGRKEADPA